MSRIKGSRASRVDVAAFRKKAPAFKKKAPPFKKMASSAPPIDMSGADEGSMDSMPEQDTDVMPTKRGMRR